MLFTIAGSSGLSMFEVNEAAEVITSACDPEAKVIFGAVIDESLGDEVKVTVIATGFREKSEKEPERAAVQPSISYQETFAKKAEERTVRKAFRKPDDKKEEPLEEVPKSKEEEELDIPAFLRKKMKDR